MADLSSYRDSQRDGIDDDDSASVQSYSTDRSYSVIFDSDDEVSDDLSDSATGSIQPYMFEPQPANITTEAAVVNIGEEEQRLTGRNNLDW
ncbi:hypothetical protein SNE40_013143 [Patella caerulea]|uniref:Uncharacterized protein n=1 Tax=Patella caerulea TaxID=87958 RepID=A0AAN8JKC2_PATCE